MITGGFITRTFIGADAMKQARLADAASALLAALRPFADIEADGDRGHIEVFVEVADLRAARDAIAKAEGPQ